MTNTPDIWDREVPHIKCLHLPVDISKVRKNKRAETQNFNITDFSAQRYLHTTSEPYPTPYEKKNSNLMLM